MVKKAPKPRMWYNGKEYVWDDVAQDYARWFRYGGHSVCRTYRDDLAYNAAVAIAKDIDRRERVLQFASLPQKSGQPAPDKKPGRAGCPPYPTVNGATFKPAKSAREAIRYARDVLDVDASEYYNNVELYVANAINAELWQAQKRFGAFGDVKVITPLKFYHKGFFDQKVWGSFVPGKRAIRLRVKIPWTQEKMSRDDWFDVVSDGQSSTRDWRHVFRHEIGHAIERYIQKRFPVSYRARIRKINQFLLRSKVGIGNLSRIADADRREAIAECIAHVLNNGTNKIALNVVSILLRGKEYDKR